MNKQTIETNDRMHERSLFDFACLRACVRVRACHFSHVNHPPLMIEPTNRVSLVLVGLVPVATGVFENFAHRAEAVRLLGLRWIHPGCQLLFRRGQRAVGALAQVVSRHEQNKKFNQASNSRACLQS